MIGDTLVLVHEQAWPTPRGTLCSLGVLRLDDAPAWKAGEDAEQIRWFDFPGPAPLDGVIAAIEDWRRNWRTDGQVRQWGVWTGPTLVGGVELRLRGDHQADLSYVVFPQHRRRGLATEAILLACGWAFDHLAVTTITAVVHHDNTASRTVLQRCGFTLQGRAGPQEHSESGQHLRYLLQGGRRDDERSSADA